MKNIFNYIILSAIVICLSVLMIEAYEAQSVEVLKSEILVEQTMLPDTMLTPIQKRYLQYCISKDCERTDTCCDAIYNLSDLQHGEDCIIFKQAISRLKRAEKKH